MALSVQKKIFMRLPGREVAMGKWLLTTVLPLKWEMKEGSQAFLLPTFRLLRMTGLAKATSPKIGQE